MKQLINVVAVYISSSPKQCWDRVEVYANSVPTIVIVEAPENTSSTSSDRPRHESTIDFLEALNADIQGARYQKHVIPFTLLVSSPRNSQPLDPATATKHLGAGAVDALHSPLSPDDLGRLVGHVREQTRPPARLVGTQMAQNLVDSILTVKKPATPCYRPDEAISQERAEFVQEAISDWHFPAHELDMDELTCGTLYMLERQLQSPDLVEYRLPREELVGFLLATRRQYKHEREVHYHNWRHAVDVTQSIYSFLVFFGLCPSRDSSERRTPELSGIERVLTPLDGLILLVSAIGHDVGHPGVNNAFLVACNHPLAQMYNDKSVLENYHCAAYSQLLRRHWPKLATISGFRSTMISTILATDMQRHFDYMSQLGELKEKVSNGDVTMEDWSDKDKEHTRELLMAILMKAADISNVARPFDVSATWAKILMDEFARQGELEAELDLPTCLFGGPPNKEDMLAAAQSQKGFMSLFGSPLFSGIAEIMPCVRCAFTTLESNQDTWERKIQAEKQQRESEGRTAPLTFSSVGKAEVEQAQHEKRQSEPTVVPIESGNAPSSPFRRQAVRIDDAASAHPAAEEKRKAAVGCSAHEDGHRASAPLLGTHGSPLSPTNTSRRSSKDVALEKLQQLSMFANQGFNSDSRRGSADLQFNQSFPTSRRGSKDESLTTILVSSKGSPNRGSPSKLSESPDLPTSTANKRQSVQHGQKASAARSSVPSSRSHATSSATATTGTLYSPSTQPSSLAPTEDDTQQRHQSLATTEDPFAAPGSWPNSADATHRAFAQEGLPAAPPVPPIPGSKHSQRGDTSPLPVSRMASGESDGASRPSPHKEERLGGGLRESRSRSRLRGLKFWKKKRDVSGVRSPDERETPRSSP
jgi:3',5'-cyclic-nucleotide phosphodiesterase